MYSGGQKYKNTSILIILKSDHHQSAWNGMKKQNKLRQTKETFQETFCKANSAQVHRGQKLL